MGQIITGFSDSRRRISHCHLYPLQAANCCRNTRLVVDEDDLMCVTNDKKSCYISISLMNIYVQNPFVFRKFRD